MGGVISFLDPGDDPKAVSAANPLPVTQVGAAFESVTLTPAMTNNYVSGNNIGGLLTFAGFTPNADYTIQRIATVISQATAIASATGYSFYIFDELPATVFANAVTPAWDPTDAPKLIIATSNSQNVALPGSAFTALSTNTFLGIVLSADAAGKVYVALQASAVGTFAAATMRITLSLSRFRSNV